MGKEDLFTHYLERERERERERVFKKARFRGPEHDEPKKISRRSFQPPRKFKILELSVKIALSLGPL